LGFILKPEGGLNPKAKPNLPSESKYAQLWSIGGVAK